jgi:hypothetical protein
LRDATVPMAGALPPPATTLGENLHNLACSLFGDLLCCVFLHCNFSAHFVLDTGAQTC